MEFILAGMKRALRRFVKSEITTRAAALAYHTVLGLVPIVGLIFWYLHRIRLTERWLDMLKTFIIARLNVQSSTVFLKYFDKLTSGVQGARWGWVGLGVLIYSAFNLLLKFGGSMDIILATASIQPEVEISVWKLSLRRLLVLLLLPLALTVSLVLTNWIEEESLVKQLFNLRTVGPVFALPLAWLTSIIAVFLVYYLTPRNRVPWRQAMKAALIVGPASELIRGLFGIYNHHAVATYRIYGVLAVIPLFILWIQISWLVLLSGALLIRFSKPFEEAGEARPGRSSASSNGTVGRP